MAAASAYEPDPGPLSGELLSEQEAGQWRRTIQAAKDDRRRMEPHWRELLAFCAGHMHHEWRGTGSGRQLYLPKLQPGKHRYTIDEIFDLRQTALGELTMEDDRPQVLFRSEDLPNEEFAEVCNDAVAAGWETEWLGDRVVEEIWRAVIDLGTAAGRCRFDPTAGPMRLGEVPHRDDGTPILNAERARAYVADQQAKGQSANLQPRHAGAIRWDYGTAFNILPPPGIKREDKFPQDVWVQPVHLDKLVERYGDRAKGLRAEKVDDVNQMSAGDQLDLPTSAAEGDGGSGKLTDHAFEYTVYQRPTSKFPRGRVLVFAGATLRVMEVRPRLDYQAPDGTWRSGVHYFHYGRLSDRFWSRGLVELAKEGNRALNTVSSQIAETIDRGQPFILGDVPARKGFPVEVLKPKPNAPAPVISSGVAPGQWMFQQRDAIREDIRRATGLQDVLQGQNPAGVGTFSQLSLLKEQAGRKFDPIVAAFHEGVTHLVEDSLWDISRYWGEKKLLALEGPDGTLKAFEFNANRMPTFWRVYIAKGVKPRSQAAQLRMVDDIFAAAVNSGAVQADPMAWVEWLKESYDAGKPVELPQAARHDQLDKALLENELLVQGGQPHVAYYDDHHLHVQVVRSLQARADASGDTELSQRCEIHALAHEQQAAANAAQHTAETQLLASTAPALGAPPQQQLPPSLGAPPTLGGLGAPPAASAPPLQ